MTTNNTNPIPLGRIMLLDVRLAFAHGLFEASAMEEGQAKKYGCGLILSPDHPQLEAIRKLQVAVANALWKDKAPAILKGLDKQDKLALHDGDIKSKYDGYPGNFFLSPNAAENARPRLMGYNPHETLTDAQLRQVLYSGCYVNASVEIWAQDNKWGQRVNATLRGVQKLRDGDAFSASRPADADEFDVVAAPTADDIA